ncbi:MAG: dUTP diphosphatase [Candidatus Omnitrophota bacterium]
MILEKTAVKLTIKVKEGCEDLPLPAYATAGSSGMDLCADVTEDVVLGPGAIRLVSCGFSLSIPDGYEAQIRPRSGIALKHGISLVNAPGTIDSDYRGIVSVILINLGKEPYVITRGSRIAQMVIQEVVRGEIRVASELEETVRSSGGFGHTGT